ncbi:unnamed protein product [Plutella xylostella]|uniref:(diamondback moth) hypothetical protein n=1 Tax=Plutella xylostella TaxID=51655 RepID=A0A8S4FFZ2_PLUXY|nr:unnamed protein product [Plutella xylostella]
MISTKQLVFLLCVSSLSAVLAAPDSAGDVPLPGPGLVYGGIPYGSMSGNVAEFFRQQAQPSGRSGNYANFNGAGNSLEHGYAPIEQYL